MSRRALAAALDAAAYALVIWYSLPDHVRQEVHAAAWHRVAVLAQLGAHRLGLAALAAESRYWKVVRS